MNEYSVLIKNLGLTWNGIPVDALDIKLYRVLFRENAVMDFFPPGNSIGHKEIPRNKLKDKLAEMLSRIPPDQKVGGFRFQAIGSNTGTVRIGFNERHNYTLLFDEGGNPNAPLMEDDD